MSPSPRDGGVELKSDEQGSCQSNVNPMEY